VSSCKKNAQISIVRVSRPRVNSQPPPLKKIGAQQISSPKALFDRDLQITINTEQSDYHNER